MKKNTIINILLISIFTLTIIVIVVSASFLYNINHAPKLLVHVIPTNGAPPYYLVQNELIDKWANNCIVLLVISCLNAFIVINSFIIFNFFISDEERVRRKSARKAKHIAALEKQLNELKKDGE